MAYKNIVSLLVFFLFLLLPQISFASAGSSGSGAPACSTMFDVLNRPTYADSPCVVKPEQFLIEAGTYYQTLHPEDGHSWFLPSAIIRYGLPMSNEFVVIASSYVQETIVNEDAVKGTTATLVGLKHQFPILGALTYAISGYAIPPSGSDNLGSEEWGGTLYFIIDYEITNTIAFGMMLGVSTESAPTDSGGGRFDNFTTDVLLAWETSEDTQIYIEYYGVTNAGPGLGDGYNMDAGFQYLLTDNIELDIEYGWRINGQFEGIENYVGAGGGIRF